jgi:Rrf2 family transcriptional regulator, cysteine metabolism repressor
MQERQDSCYTIMYKQDSIVLKIEVYQVKISTKGRYGLTIMIDLAKKHGNGPTSLKNIARENDLSEHYLEQLASPLRNAGLIKSIRGAYGGYILAKEPATISAGDIIRVLEGPITPVEGIEDEEPAKQALWMRIRDAVKDVLDTTTLEDLANHNGEQPEEGYMFYI